MQHLTDRLIEPLVNAQNGVAKAFYGSRIVQMMGGIHVLPEMMLHCVDGHEGEHHHVGWMFFHQVKTRAQPLMVEFVHLGQDLLAPRIGGHVAEVTNIELEAPEQVHQLRAQLGRINERALLRWRIHAGNLEAV